MANILIVDDEVDMLKLIKRVLEKDNHYVTLINHSKDIFHIDFRRYDLLLLDIMMPDIDGFEI